MTQRNPALLALLAYSVLSWLLLSQGAGLTTHVLGFGADPGLIMWFLAWWPWALTHHALALHTTLVWQPIGLNLAWTTSVPLLALLAAPVTLTAGPLAAFNLLTIAAPALSAWAAYFLCRGLGAVPGAAFFGGLLFGFSSYMGAQSFDHLNLSFCALLPLAVLVAVRRVRGDAGRLATVLWMALLLGGQFLISEEILATFCFFAVLAFCLAYAVERGWRPGLRALALDLILAAPLALLPAAPFIFAMITGVKDIDHSTDWQIYFAIDALNLVIPTQGTWLGGTPFQAVSRQFTGALDEQGGYLGLPLLLLLFFILRGAPARRRLWLPFAVAAVAVAVALGPVLQYGGRVTAIPLPWVLLAHLPLMGMALPGRCMVYVFLAVAVIVSLWLSWQPSLMRFLAAAAVCLSLLPVPHPPLPSPHSSFFRPGRVQQILGPEPVLLILPFGIHGYSSYWQAENHFGFRQAGGYLGYPPGWAFRNPAVTQIAGNKLRPGAMQDFVDFCRRYEVGYVIAAPQTPPEALAALASLGWTTQKVDDVIIYTVPQVALQTP
jgi:hypothetical protein